MHSLRTSARTSRSVPSMQQVQRKSARRSKTDRAGYSGDSGSNIKVYVRCRSRNDREIEEKSSVVISTMGPGGKEMVLQNPGGALTKKTYSFDQVFGVESDQETLFNSVAKTYIAEMLQGYNCTVFAYGQTGTGKTYTMSGDINIWGDVHSQDKILLGEHAGIIPRVLLDIFQQLSRESSNNKNYSVKISFLELYNERLRDLLSENDTEETSEEQIRIFDNHSTIQNSSSSSIKIKGMEEIYIKNAYEGLRLLMDGSLKRKVASTKLNDLSSRSHTIFTISTQITKIDPVTNQEYVKIGKLNLVDLAGSENINRSGAENKRAQEAGLINKSLLTLGRVINALVDRSNHIPYRESKLTRLLQDSLGGKTKTCIIATVSPARISMDETISTLEYATRAKSIQNTPQVNQSVSKDSCIVEYVNEIEKLRNDLKASRSKEGIYITQEQLELYESNNILVTEQRAKIDNMEEQLKKFKTKFAEQTELNKQLAEKLQESELNLQKTTERYKQLEQMTMTFQAKCDEYVDKINVIHVKNLSTFDKIKQERDEVQQSSTLSRNSLISVLDTISQTTPILDEMSKLVNDFSQSFILQQSALLDSLSNYCGQSTGTIQDQLTKVQLDSALEPLKAMQSSIRDYLSKLSAPREKEMEEITVMHKQILLNCQEEIISTCDSVKRALSECLNKTGKQNEQKLSNLFDGIRQAINEKLDMVRQQKLEIADLKCQLKKKTEDCGFANGKLQELHNVIKVKTLAPKASIMNQLIENMKHAQEEFQKLDTDMISTVSEKFMELNDSNISQNSYSMDEFGTQAAEKLEIVEESISTMNEKIKKQYIDTSNSIQADIHSIPVLQNISEISQAAHRLSDFETSKPMKAIVDETNNHFVDNMAEMEQYLQKSIKGLISNINSQADDNKQHIQSVIQEAGQIYSFVKETFSGNFEAQLEKLNNTLVSLSQRTTETASSMKNLREEKKIPKCHIIDRTVEESVKYKLPTLENLKDLEIYKDLYTTETTAIVTNATRNISPTKPGSFVPSTPVPVPDHPLPKVLIPKSVNSSVKRSASPGTESKWNNMGKRGFKMDVGETTLTTKKPHLETNQ